MNNYVIHKGLSYVVFSLAVLALIAGAQAVCNDCVLQVIAVSNSVCQGEPVVYQVKITNVFDQPKTISLSAAGDVRLRSDLPSYIEIGAFETKSITVSFTPIGEELGSHRITVKAEGYGASDTDDAVFTVKDCYASGLDLLQQNITICESSVGRVDFLVKNNGQAQDTYRMSLTGIPDALGVSVIDGEMSLSPGASRIGTINVNAFGKDYGIYTLQLNADSYREHVSKQFNVEIKNCYHTTVSVPEVFTTCPDAGLTYTASVKNNGCVRDSYTITLSGSCSAKTTVTAFSLEPGQTRDVPITVNSKTQGECDTTITAAGLFDSDSASTHVDVKKCYAVDIEIIPDRVTTCQGEPATFDVWVKNTGFYSDVYNVSLNGVNKKLPKPKLSLASSMEDIQRFDISGTWCASGDVPFTATAVGVASDSDSALLSIVKAGAQCAALEITPALDPMVLSCEGGAYNMFVKNTGYAKQEVTLSLSSPGFILQPANLTLLPQDVRPVSLYLLPSEDISELEFPLVVIAESQYRKAYLEINVDLLGPSCSVSRPSLVASNVELPVEIPINLSDSGSNGTASTASGSAPTPTVAASSVDPTAGLALLGVLIVLGILLLFFIVYPRKGLNGRNGRFFPEATAGPGMQVTHNPDEKLAAIREAITKSSK